MDFSVRTLYIDGPSYLHEVMLVALLLVVIVAVQFALGAWRRLRRSPAAAPRQVRTIHIFAISVALIVAAAATFSFSSNISDVARYERETHNDAVVIRGALKREFRDELAVALSLILLTLASAAVRRREV